VDKLVLEQDPVAEKVGPTQDGQDPSSDRRNSPISKKAQLSSGEVRALYDPDLANKIEFKSQRLVWFPCLCPNLYFIAFAVLSSSNSFILLSFLGPTAVLD